MQVAAAAPLSEPARPADTSTRTCFTPPTWQASNQNCYLYYYCFIGSGPCLARAVRSRLKNPISFVILWGEISKCLWGRDLTEQSCSCCPRFSLLT